MNELKDIKVGDLVCYSNIAIDGHAIRVTKITKTMIICGNSRFRKCNGRLVGGDCWNITRISILTPEKKEKILKRKLIDEIRDADLTPLESSQLKKILEVINNGK